jgi:hypothetical protein
MDPINGAVMPLISESSISMPASPKRRWPSFTAVILAVSAVVSLLVAIGVLSNAKSAVHEIEAGIGFLCFICSLSGAAIVSEIRSLRE